MSFEVPLGSRALEAPSPEALALAADLRGLVGEGGASTDELDRAAAARDMWPKSLLWLKQGKSPPAPDVVVWPTTVEQVAAIVRYAAPRGIAVTPYGAGSGVAGGVIPLRGGITLDLKRMNAIRKIDPERLRLEVEAGALGLPLEQALAAQQLTLGHFPSSIGVSTVGGWIAARSAGQSSARYGKIEDMVLGMTCVLGTGEVIRPQRPVAGPDLCDLFLGSEGTLGVITDASLRLRPAPKVQIPRGFRFARLGQALLAMEEVFHAGLRPSVVRLYDPFDSFMALRAGARGKSRALPERVAQALHGAKQRALSASLRFPQFVNIAASTTNASLLVVVHEGEEGLTELEAARTASCLRAQGGVDLGPAPGTRWLEKRYSISFEMPKFFASGSWVDTFEVAIAWGKVEELYDEVRRAVAPYAFVMAHFSHAYADGCAIYFSFAGAASRTPSALRNYEAAWSAALDVADALGATITHHHGVGLLKAPWLARELGKGGARLFRAAKASCDPAGILNPGKLFADVEREGG